MPSQRLLKNEIENTIFRITFIRDKRLPKTISSLISYEYIKRNVDDFFLSSQNHYVISECIRLHDAIAYMVEDGDECLGCFLALREDENLMGHFFFRIIPNFDIVYYTHQIMLRMIRYFNRHSIRVSKVIGQIPLWNLAATHILEKLGANKQIQCSSTFTQNGISCPCSEWIIEIPEYLHPLKLRISKDMLDKHE